MYAVGSLETGEVVDMKEIADEVRKKANGEVVGMIDAVVGMLQIFEAAEKMANAVVIRTAVPGRIAVMYVEQSVELQTVTEGIPEREGVSSNEPGFGYVCRNLAGNGAGNQLVDVVMMIADADPVLGAAIGSAGIALDLGIAAAGDLGIALGFGTGSAGFDAAVRDLGADGYTQYHLGQCILTVTALAPLLEIVAVREPATAH